VQSLGLAISTTEFSGYDMRFCNKSNPLTLNDQSKYSGILKRTWNNKRHNGPQAKSRPGAGLGEGPDSSGVSVAIPAELRPTGWRTEAKAALPHRG